MTHSNLDEFFVEFGNLKDVGVEDEYIKELCMEFQKALNKMFPCDDSKMLERADVYEVGPNAKFIDTIGGKGTAQFLADSIRYWYE